MELEHLGYGWMAQNIDRTGTGFGVIARSIGWNDQIGTIGRELGSLISRPSERNSTIEIATHRGYRLLVRKSPVANSRQGSHFVHLVDSENLPMTECIDILRAGTLYSSPDQFPDRLPTASARPLTSDVNISANARWTHLPSEADINIVGAAVLASLNISSTKVALVGAPLVDLMTVLAEVSRTLPPLMSELIRFCGTTGDFANVGDSETRLVFAETSKHKARADYVVIDVSTSAPLDIQMLQPFLSVMRRAVAWRSAGGAIAPHLTSFDQLGKWLATRELMLQPVAELSGPQLHTILSLGRETLDWLDRPSNLDAVVDRALRDEQTRRLLIRLPGIEHLQTLTPTVCRAVYRRELRNDARDHVLKSFGVDYNRYAAEVLKIFWSDWDSGRRLPASQENTVFPLLVSDPRMAERQNIRTLDDLLASPTFRQYVASGTTEIVSRMLTLEFRKSANKRDYQAISAVAHRQPGALVKLMLDPSSTPDSLDYTRAVDELDLAHSAELLIGLSAKPAIPYQLILDSIARSARPESELRELLHQVWPLLQPRMHIPPQLRDWLVVDKSSARGNARRKPGDVSNNHTNPDLEPYSGRTVENQPDQNESRPKVMQRIRQAFRVSD